jgi:hypothetical protein
MNKEHMEEPKQNSSKENNKNTLIEQIRTLGLCVMCGEKYYRDHQYKIKVHMMIEQEDEKEVSAVKEEYGEDEYKVEEVVKSMCVILDTIHLSTIRLRDKFGKQNVCAF